MIEDGVGGTDARVAGGWQMDEPEATPWVLMGLLAFTLLTYPVLAVFNHRTPVFGVPALLLYIFGIWGAFILFSMRYRRRG